MSGIPIMKPWLGEAEAAAAAEAVRSGWVAQGPRVAAFEAAFAGAVEAPHAVAVSSATTGLHLALLLAGIEPGDEVIVPSLSFIATANSARYVGATPVFADVDLATQNLTPDTIAAVLTERTRAVIVVHQAGTPADLDAIHALCRAQGVAVIEDAACAIGATYKGRPVGALSEQTVFSFHPRKILTTGEGGMLTLTSDGWSERARRLREHGMSVSAAERHRLGSPVIEQYLELGFNFRMTDLQAAVGLVQLGKLPEMIARRRALAARYQEAFADLPVDALSADPAWGETNHQSFWVLLSDDAAMGRNELMAALAAEEVVTRRGIMAAHLEPAYRDRRGAPLPNTERLTTQSLILPLYHQLREDEQDRVIGLVRSALLARRAAA